jgi:hypothetical protein
VTDINKQQKPLNSSFTPNAQSAGRDGSTVPGNETKTPTSQTRLRPKTKLRGLPQENTFAINQRPIEPLPAPARPLNWQTTAQSEQAAQSSSIPPVPNLNNPAYMSDNPFSSTTAPFNANLQKSATEQAGINSSTLSNPLFPPGNTQQLKSGNTGQFSPINRSGNTGQLNPINKSGNTGQFNPVNRSGNTGQFNFNTSANQFGAVTRKLDNSTGMLPNPNNTGTLIHPAGEYSGDTGMLRLNQAVKVVRIPVAGKPGEYKTGILPVLDQSNTGTLPPSLPQSNSWQKKIKLIIIGSLIFLVLFASGIYLLSLEGTKAQITKNSHPSSQTQLNLNATTAANVKATATFTASLLVSDSLAYNTRGWSTKTEQGIHRTFANNAYHIRSDTSAYFAPSILWNEVPPTKYSYSLDMQEVTGNANSQFNYYGLLLNYNQDKANNPTFYLFCIVNQKSGSQYQFVHFDNKTSTKWSKSVWNKQTGKEFHSGKAKNTLMVQVDGSRFTFWANGVKLGTTQDKTFSAGSIGMGVNGVPGGAEVAFTNLILAQN